MEESNKTGSFDFMAERINKANINFKAKVDLSISGF